MACSVHNEDPESFSHRLVTGDESWFHCHTTEKSNNYNSFQRGVCELGRTTQKTALLNPSDCYQKEFWEYTDLSTEHEECSEVWLCGCYCHTACTPSESHLFLNDPCLTPQFLRISSLLLILVPVIGLSV